MIRIELVSFEKLDLYRRTRLAALLDTPLAFGSTYARESAFDESTWRERIARNRSDQSCGYLAIDDERESDVAAGLAGAFIGDDPTMATLVSMWIAPTHRRRGVGRMLVEACLRWCVERKLASIDLLVTDWNDGAIAFYEQLGFRKTGRTEPYPNDPRFTECQMIKVLSPPE
jgi:ribosomal protein S18 acetylase RimI-like enzyme